MTPFGTKCFRCVQDKCSPKAYSALSPTLRRPPKNGQGLVILSIVIITFMEREKAEGMGIYYANEHAWWLVALDFSGFRVALSSAFAEDGGKFELRLFAGDGVKGQR